MKITKLQILIIGLLAISFCFVMGTGLLEAKKENMKNIVKDVNIEKKETKIQGKKPQRYMYMTSGISRNSSYDSRGGLNTKFEPKKTGAFVNSVLQGNDVNQII